MDFITKKVVWLEVYRVCGSDWQRMFLYEANKGQSSDQQTYYPPNY